MSRRQPAEPPLLRVIRRRVVRSASITNDRQKTTIDIEAYRSTRWASATFEGHRHEFAVRIDGRPDFVDAESQFVRRALAAEDIRMRGELLADVMLVGEEVVSDGVLTSRRLRYEALTVID